MNKYIIIIIVIILLIGGGVLYKQFGVSDKDKGIETGVIKEFTIVAKKDNWRFMPDEIDVTQGDRIILTVINEDDYDHGIAIDAFGVSQRLPANGTIKAEFVVTQPGVFPYYCSVPCGEGEVDGVERGHFDQIGRINVRSLISETN
jgi:cytochrome c oxidase subunit II